jgi:predicted transcriptional regulator
MTVDLAHVRVRDCMRPGMLSCPSNASLAELAASMAEHRVHAIAVRDRQSSRTLGLVTDRELVAAIADEESPRADALMVTQPPAVSADESLIRAAQLMTRHGVNHLLVLDHSSGHAVGVISTLDLVEMSARSAMRSQ